MLKKTLTILFSMLVLSSVLAGCNTTHGVGEDIEAGGRAIQRSVN